MGGSRNEWKQYCGWKQGDTEENGSTKNENWGAWGFVLHWLKTTRCKKENQSMQLFWLDPKLLKWLSYQRSAGCIMQHAAPNGSS